MREETLWRRGGTLPDESNPYWISFADIMAGLLLIFILAVVFLILQLQQTQARVQGAIRDVAGLNDLRAEILNGIKADLAKKGIDVVISEDKTVLRIPDDVLSFDTGKYVIPDPLQEVVGEIGRILLKHVTKDDRQSHIDTIFIEGHTDSRPADELLEGMGNWGLSAARAISIWKQWSESPEFGDSYKSLTNQRQEKMFSVSGYGATRRLIVDDYSPGDQRKNRRIDIRLSMRTPLMQDYSSVLEEF